jgi:1,4-dihydroxy-2-naphthoate octaprenyltransferase
MQGADTANRKGPTRAVQAGLISPEAMLRATAGMFAITAITCVYLVWRAGWVMAVLGIVSITLGILYTAGRKSLAYLGLGDIFVLLFFGPIAVSGTYFAQLRQLTGLAAWIGAVPGLISVGLLIINNLRDVDEDRQAGKKTLAVRFGRAFARWEYALCMLVAAIIPVLVWWNEWLPMSALMLSLAVAPGFMIARRIWWLDGAALNPFLGKTALVLLLFTVTFGVGCLFLW